MDTERIPSEKITPVEGGPAGLNIQEEGRDQGGRLVKKTGKMAAFKKAASYLKEGVSGVGKKIVAAKVGIARSRVGKFVSSIMTAKPKKTLNYQPKPEVADRNEGKLKAYLENPEEVSQLEEAAKAGHPEANYRYYLYFKESDSNKAIKYLVKAVEYGHTKAMIAYSEYIKTSDPRATKKYLNKAADLGDEEAQYKFWDSFKNDKAEKGKALTYLEKSAKAGYGPACEVLAIRSWGDPEKGNAIRFFERAYQWYKNEVDPRILAAQQVEGSKQKPEEIVDVDDMKLKAEALENVAAKLLKALGWDRAVADFYGQGAKLRKWVRTRSVSGEIPESETVENPESKMRELLTKIDDAKRIAEWKKKRSLVEKDEAEKKEIQERIERKVQISSPKELLAQYKAMKDTDPGNAIKFIKKAVYQGDFDAIITWYEKFKSDEAAGRVAPETAKEVLRTAADKSKAPEIMYRFWLDFNDDPSEEVLASEYLLKCLELEYGPARVAHAERLEEASKSIEDEGEKRGMLQAVSMNYLKASQWYRKEDKGPEAEKYFSKCLNLGYGPAYVVRAEELEKKYKTSEDKREKRNALRDACMYYEKASLWYREEGNKLEAEKYFSKCLDLGYGPAWVAHAEELEKEYKTSQDINLLKAVSRSYERASEWFWDENSKDEAEEVEAKKRRVDFLL